MEYSNMAIQDSLHGERVYCKFLSANDTGRTGAHQAGILISKTASEMLFTQKELKENHILKKEAKVRWQDNSCTDSVFTWYESKNELRLTRFGKGFPFLCPEYTGALFVFIKIRSLIYNTFSI